MKNLDYIIEIVESLQNEMADLYFEDDLNGITHDAIMSVIEYILVLLKEERN